MKNVNWGQMNSLLFKLKLLTDCFEADVLLDV